MPGRWDEASSRRWLAWLARSMQRAGHSVFLLETVQPLWLRDVGSYFLVADAMLGAAIGILVAPLVLLIPGQFGPGHIESLRITVATAVLTGTILGALTSGRSRTLAAPPIRASDEHDVQESGAETAASASVSAGAATPDPTVMGTTNVVGDGTARAKKKGCGGFFSVLRSLWALSYVGVLVGLILYALNWLASYRFATAVGLGNALAVLFVSIAMLLYRIVEGRLLRGGAPFIRPAEALGWSTRSSLRVAGAAALWSPLLLYPATRFLDGWLGNRPEATIAIQGRGFSFKGQGGIAAHFLGLTTQGVTLLLFLLIAMLAAAAAIGGLRSRFVDMKTRPNQGMRLSSANSLRCMILVGLPVGVVLGLSAMMVRPLAARLPSMPRPVTLELLESRVRPYADAYAGRFATLLDRFASLPDSTPQQVLYSIAGEHRLLRLLVQGSVNDDGPAYRKRMAARFASRFDADTLARDLAKSLYAFRYGGEREVRRAMARSVTLSERRLHVDEVIASLATGPNTRAIDELFAPAPTDDPDVPTSADMSLSGSSGGLQTFWNGLALGIALGGLAALLNGGMAVIRHYLLRLWLLRRGVAPLDYVGFLEHAANELGFLQRVGGGYMFIHRMLLEHFADEGRAAGSDPAHESA